MDLALKEGTFEPLDPPNSPPTWLPPSTGWRWIRDLQEKFGQAGRKRVEDHFSWTAIARQTLELYRSL